MSGAIIGAAGAATPAAAPSLPGTPEWVLARTALITAVAAPAISVTVTIGFFVTFYYVVNLKIDANTSSGQIAMVNQLLGFLGAAFTSVISYWLGSSAGSARKTELLNQAQAST